MKYVRSIALGLAVLAGSATVAAAQSATATPPAQRPKGAWMKHGGHRAGIGARRLFRGIDLSADQKTRIQQIAERYRTEFRSIAGLPANGDKSGDVKGERRERPQLTAEQRQKLQALHERQLAEMRGVLTAAQQQRFDANVAEMKSRRDANRKNHEARSQRQG